MTKNYSSTLCGFTILIISLFCWALDPRALNIITLRIDEELPNGTELSLPTSSVPVFLDDNGNLYSFKNLGSDTRYRILHTEKAAKYIEVDETNGKFYIKSRINRENLCEESRICCVSDRAFQIFSQLSEEECFMDFTLKVLLPGSKQLLTGKVKVFIVDKYAA